MDAKIIDFTLFARYEDSDLLYYFTVHIMQGFYSNVSSSKRFVHLYRAVLLDPL